MFRNKSILSDHTVDARIKKDRLRKQTVTNQRQKIARINPATVRHCVSSAIKQIVDLLRPITPFLYVFGLTIYRKPMYRIIMSMPCVHGVI